VTTRAFPAITEQGWAVPPQGSLTARERGPRLLLPAATDRSTRSHPEEHDSMTSRSHAPSTRRIWILTDRRYLDQRMPLALVEWLRARGQDPEIVIADEDALLGCVAPLASQLAPSPWSRLKAGDLVVARSRDPLALALLEEAEARGARPLDSTRAVERVRNKATCALSLARRGLPVPRTVLARHPSDLDCLPKSAFPLVVKPVLGDNARGVQVVHSPTQMRALDWDHGLLLAQAFVDTGGMDIKLYVAGDRVWATRRPSPLTPSDDPGELIAVTPALRRIADGCRGEFGLQLFGADVMESPDGALGIVDVNEFPNYTGVEEAPAAVGAMLLAETRSAWRPRRSRRPVAVGGYVPQATVAF
jgi:ribosomal protein S6--L-glutamate ligase